MHFFIATNMWLVEAILVCLFLIILLVLFNAVKRVQSAARMMDANKDTNPSDLNASSKLVALTSLASLGIVFAHLGTSPLYVMRAVVATNVNDLSQPFILGVLSCVIWVLTLQVTIKCVLLTLRVDNNEEGGILALYSLIRKIKPKKIYIVALLGAAAFVVDGFMVPSLTIVSVVEGLESFYFYMPVVPISLAILFILFLLQQFGSDFIGQFLGPIMLLWFLMLAILGLSGIYEAPQVLHALNPYYAFNFLTQYPYAFIVMSAIFLCVTGIEALYSDLGRCGSRSIQVAWIFVKSCLILNYLGQGAWILQNPQATESGMNPFFGLMPIWFILPGLLIAVVAAIAVSQSLIANIFTIFSEAMSLNFWPRQEIVYPTHTKGHMYLPWINWILMLMCFAMVSYFQSATAMVGAYGLSMSIVMLATSVLLIFYFRSRQYSPIFTIGFGVIFLFVELGFLYANLLNFFNGGWLMLALTGILFVMMAVWYAGRRLKNKYVEYIKIAPYLPIIEAMKSDETIPKYATNLVYVSRAFRQDEIENKIIYSLIKKQPKRADHYWLLHVENDVNPYTFEYRFVELIPQTLYRVYFKLGFKMQPMVNIYFQQVLEDLEKSSDFDAISHYSSLREANIQADFKYILIDRVFDHEYMLPASKRFILTGYNLLKKIGIADSVALGLEMHNCEVEKAPMLANIVYKKRIVRREEE